jgi:siroheme synthase (precorrin-2 oxidase/ferrochelatase)
MAVDAPLYPVGLVVTGRRCVVVGDGPIAAQKAEGLRRCGADATIIEVADYEPARLDGAWLVISCDRAINAAVVADATDRGIWANAADDPEHCAFVLPAVLRDGPVVITVSTSGHSPALASHLRTRIGELLGPGLGDAALALDTERRAIQAAGGTTEGRNWGPSIAAALAASQHP